MSSKSPDASSFAIAFSIFGVAFAGLAGCSAPPDGAPLSPETAVEITSSTASASTVSSPSPAVGACLRTGDGVVTTPDTCAGTASGRVVVTLDEGATCTSLFGVGMGIAAPNGFRKKYLFDSAPLALREAYCVLEDTTAIASVNHDARAQAVVASLCGVAHVLDVARDCSAFLPLSSVVPNAYAPPGASLVEAPLASPSGHGTSTATATASVTPPTNDPTEGDMGKNSCDVCVTAGNGQLFVSLPPSFTNASTAPSASASPSTLTVRVSTAGAPDLYIAPPPRSQSFVVRGVNVAPDATLTIYAPGVVPPPREPNE